MASANTVALTDANFESEVLKADKPVLVDFWAEWCGPCRQLAPIVDEIADEMGDRVKVCKMDVQEHNGVAAQHQITAIPTLMVFKGGELVERIAGLQPKRNLIEILERHV